MKQLLIGLALLAALFSSALINSVYFEIKVSDIKNKVISEIDADAFSALEDWKSLKGYASIMLRQTETDAVTHAFYEYLETVGSDNGFGYTKEKLIYHLDSISTMEKLNFGSIF